MQERRDGLSRNGVKVIVKGVVQGVGFRPFVYNLAQSLNLRGYVRNSDDGVVIEIAGEKVPLFIDSLRDNAPPLAKIDSLEVIPSENSKPFSDFTIMQSEDKGGFTLVSPDVSVCDDCLKELMDPGDRRYLYPFINCTNCGPRYTITERIPYDRKHTTMRGFVMCPACEREYHDPSNRRFHAQPNACPDCGPHIGLKIVNESLRKFETSDSLGALIELLGSGYIAAIKGLGGFHIACDATNEDAVRRLRELKRKSNKPFAVMVSDPGFIEMHCHLSDQERNALHSPARPIVLLKKKKINEPIIAESVSPGNAYLGCMLPYTPLHFLLFHHPAGKQRPLQSLVMTSGNLSEEPIVIDNGEAREKLVGIADCFLFHNRDIFMRVDDSVTAFILEKKKGRQQECIIRRSRGYVPEAIALPSDGPEVLGCGADLKNTFTLTKGKFAIMSQHIGDMENYESLIFFEETLSNLKSLYRINPAAIGYDMHPEYTSTRWAKSQDGVDLVPVQHHHAHVASVMALHGINDCVIGIVFDGTGFGTDGNLWGGEFFTGGLRELKRAAHFQYIPLIGGESSVRHPWKTAVSFIKHAAGKDTWAYLERIGFISRLGSRELGNLLALSENRQFCPLSSGAGRLFDAVASIINICDTNTFEAEAPMKLEWYLDSTIAGDYPYDIFPGDPPVIDFSRAILSIIDDHMTGKGADTISTRFHNTVLNAIVRMAEDQRAITGNTTVILSGGTFQNRYLLSRSTEMLSRKGFAVFTNSVVPNNDACISLGQAYLVREKILRSSSG
ncbi:MAG: carbamoyltransferase HypF [bacterium]